MRLIDADELIVMEFEGIRFVPEDFIRDAPTIDVVEVVRCKDCVYWKYKANYKGDEWGACLFLEDVEHWTEDTAFCSFGERSEE